MPDIKRVIALGFFDGVHLGHQKLLDMTRRRAAELGARPSVVSFDIHPDTLVRGESVALLNSPAGRAELIRRVGGIDDIILLHFDERLMHMPWLEFMALLTAELGAAHLVLGHDFCCGWRGEGRAPLIADYCRENGLGCDVIDEVIIEGLTVSSTHIRRLVSAGDMQAAARFLGHAHTLIDTVRSGYRVGRTLGTPTINMAFPPDVIIPRHGVYAARVVLPDGAWPAVTNIGVRPTFGGGGVSVESYILDFDRNLYGASVYLEFNLYLRPETKFPSPEALRRQIERDVASAREYFRV